MNSVADDFEPKVWPKFLTWLLYNISVAKRNILTTIIHRSILLQGKSVILVLHIYLSLCVPRVPDGCNMPYRQPLKA